MTSDVPYESLFRNLRWLKGREDFICSCIYHDDSTPSLSVSLKKGVFYCFGCGKRGTLKTLLRDVGIQTMVVARPRFDPVRKTFKSKGMEISGNVSYDLENDRDVQQYFQKRGLSYSFLKSHFRFGRPNPFFRVNGTLFTQDRLLIFLEDKEFSLVEGRTLIPGVVPKVLYPKGASTDYLGNYSRIDPEKPVYLVEGLMDLFKVYSAGFRNVVCAFGSNLSLQKLFLLQKLNPEKVVLVPDNDQAGGKFLQSLIDQFSTRFSVAFVPPEYKDIGEVPLEKIPDILENKVSVFDHLKKIRFFSTISETNKRRLYGLR